MPPLTISSGYQYTNSFRGHEDAVTACIPSVQHVITTSLDGYIRLWNLEGQLQSEWQAHDQGITAAVAVGELTLTVSWDRTAKLWNVAAHECISGFQSQSGALLSVCANVASSHGFAGTNDGTVYVWELQSGEMSLSLQGHQESVLALIVEDDLLCSGSEDCTIRFWQWETGECIHIAKGHEGPITALAIAPSALVSASHDGTVRFWHKASATAMQVLDCEGMLTCLFLDDQFVLAGSTDRQLYVWEVSGPGKVRRMCDTVAKSGVMSLSMHFDSLFICSADCTTRKWAKIKDDGLGGQGMFVGDYTELDVLSVTSAATARKHSSTSARSHEGDETARLNAITPTGGQLLAKHWDKVHRIVSRAGLLASVSSDRTIGIHPIGLKRKDVVETIKGSQDAVFAVCFADDANKIVTGGAHRLVQVWDIRSGECEVAMEGHSDWISALATSGTGSGFIYSASWDTTIRIWDSKGRTISVLKGHEDPIYCLSVNGVVLFSACRAGKIKAWNTRSGDCLRTFDGNGSAITAIHADDPLLVAASLDKSVRMWSLQTGEALKTVSLSAGVTCMHPLAGCFAAGCVDGSATIHTLSGRELVSVRLPDASVTCIEIVGRSLIVGSDLGHIWCFELRDEHMAAIQAANSSAVDKRKAVGSLAARLADLSQAAEQSAREEGVVKQPKQEGWLYKQGFFFKRWSKRYFVLNEGTIFIYATEIAKREKPLDVILAKDLVKIETEGNKLSKNLEPISLVTTERKIDVAADSKSEHAKWVSALEKQLSYNSFLTKLEAKAASRAY